MTHNEQLELIRQKCIEANIDKEWHWHCPARKSCSVEFDEPIRLADVLLAIGNKVLDHAFFVSSGGYFYEERAGEDIQMVGSKWDLRKDDLTEQSNECIEFISSLLSV